jgi:hypothetical protein
MAAMLAAGLASAQPRPARESDLSRWTSPTLTTFASEAELRRFLRAAQRAEQLYGAAPAPRRPLRFAALQQEPGTQSDAQQPPEDPCANPASEAARAACSGAADESSISVTGARVSSRGRSSPGNPSITNVQEQGVDEGDIVKQIGQFLLVLQDGRLFSVDTRPANGAGLALVDRADVYRNSSEDTWYDEMLVSGSRILVTGYSYAESASELNVFRIDARGRLRREGTFYLSSNDYYDTRNYASRLVGDRLVVYTPIDLSNIDLEGRFEWPAVRRWQPEASRTRPARGRPLLGARDIYRPVRDTRYPMIHSISVCPLASAAAGDLACTTTGFIAERDHEFHVSPTDAFIWTADWSRAYRSSGDFPACPAGHRPAAADTVLAALFRLPLAGGAPAVLGTRGHPVNYLSLDSGGGHFRALVRWPSGHCNHENEAYPLTLFDTGLGRFGPTLVEAPARAYTAMPAVGTASIENRFTDRYLVYGGRAGWSSYPPEEPSPLPVPAAVVPLDRPAAARLIDMPHSILRIEQVGENVILTGYRDDSALDVSMIDLRAAPRLASTVRLAGRYETEGRSHAFNSLAEADGSGVMGVPTTHREEQSGRWWSYSDASDVSFLAVDARGRLAPLGELLAYANGPDQNNEADEIDDEGVWENYHCEVSCIDWYGNSRPIFTDGRIFALSGAELIEGRIEGGRIREQRRLNISVGPPRR